MKRLKRHEELEILKSISPYDFIDNGSSRAVFQYGKDKVVKIALDKQGQFQNHIEKTLFEKYGREHLAEIFSYGKYIVVMEMVDTMDIDEAQDLADAAEEQNDFKIDTIMDNYGKEYDMRIAEKVLDTVYFLEGTNGTTSDNYQVGISGDRVVAYDYGYVSQYRSKSVSEHLRDFVEFNGTDDLIDLIKRRLLTKSFIPIYSIY